VSARWFERRVLVTVGTGGVGKTTIAAAIALEAARRGKRVLVLTIDPALRLADALGLEALSNEPRRVPHATLEAVARRRACADSFEGGELYAMMLDTQRTFDELVERFAPDPETRTRILENRIYRSLTDSLSGTREYSAMEKLHQVYADGTYDLVVLDTPPASHALQFLEAPRRLLGFLDGGFLQLLLQPAAAIGRTSFRLFRFGSNMAIRAFEKLTGLGFLNDLSDFLLAFEGLLGGFQERARSVSRLLRSPECGFVLVAGPEPEQIRRTAGFWAQLREDRVQLVGLVMNRVSRWLGAGEPPAAADASFALLAESLRASCEPEVADALLEVVRRDAARARRDRAMCEQLEKLLPLQASEAHRIPLFSAEIHSVDGLQQLCAAIFDESDCTREDL